MSEPTTPEVALTEAELMLILSRVTIPNHWPRKYRKVSIETREVMTVVVGNIRDEIRWALTIKASEGGTVHACQGGLFHVLLAGDDVYCEECVEAAETVLAAAEVVRDA